MLIKRYWIAIFITLLLADLLAVYADIKELHFVLKSLLMPVLMVALIKHKANSGEMYWRIILAGLVTAWAGDVLLLFSGDMPRFFMMGLIFFLITHLAYIFYFSRYKKNNRWLLRNPLPALITIGYAVALFIFLQPLLGAMLWPVAAYTLVITIMLLQAIGVQPFIQQKKARLYFVAGAVLFVISDSLLAINKFQQPFTGADIWVMLTYGAAQLIIVKAALLNTDRRAA